ncbi:MAG: methyl-accepting chemotaxis protein, partial [Cellulomonadaceae bacterium]|nr:methyl-accepting chemotaxis protein [Cellulomonadaceae bacterium]
MGGPAAVDAAALNRAGYLTSAQGLRDTLEQAPVELFTDDEAAVFSEIDALWADFFVADDQVVALYQKGTPASLDQADAAIIDVVYPIYNQIWELTAQLLSSLVDRSAAVQAQVAASQQQLQLINILAVVIGAAAVALFALRAGRRSRASLMAVQNALEGMGRGDLTVSAGVTGHDEVGQMAAALTRAQTSLRSTLAGVAEASTMLAAASEEMTAAGLQVTQGAEETSAQAGVVAAAAEQVSRNVQTV